ncbi:hypothetical protein [Hydrogenobacter hydrogenophilus]|uniref:Uncharacterized protein n=1 Tax=Hydrogenobacter hydrogenophilus TaxID=35835 RepID=A0A285P001_9AQUI|nr:hypothetical protein [Hydrogenobacter hydrogenophilus]SNZ14758.1 hypothetical protein SAMN06265353_1194 [Hydrogenobacter hydrogenophilus]
MDKVYSIEDSITMIVEDFFKDIDKKEPFNTELSQYVFMLKSKLLQILSQFSGDYDMGSKSLNSAVEALGRALENAVNGIDLQQEKQLERAVKALESTNQLLKEFLYDPRVKDKETISLITGKIGDMVEKLGYEIRRRSGFIKRIKRLFGI